MAANPTAAPRNRFREKALHPFHEGAWASRYSTSGLPKILRCGDATPIQSVFPDVTLVGLPPIVRCIARYPCEARKQPAFRQERSAWWDGSYILFQTCAPVGKR